jgi:hypothetical protein
MDKGNVSNIDELLMGGQGNSQQPPTPESKPDEFSESAEGIQETRDDLYGLDEKPEPEEAPDELSDDETPDEPQDKAPKEEIEYDEYGNQTEGMKKRLKKQASKYEAELAELRAQVARLTPQQQQQVQQAAQSFEGDPNSEDSWEAQLNAHIEQTVVNMQSRKEQQAREAEDREIQAKFETKLVSGMERFSDFRETIQALPCQIDYDMAQATRSLDDPAAFLYAAAKRHPEELQRISQLRDPYAKVREMGKLEERMRKTKPTTKAPRPLGRTKEDAHIPQPKPKQEDSIEDLIAKNDAKKLAQVRARGRR